MKTKELGSKENRGIQNIGIDDSKGHIIINKRKARKIWENFIPELCDWSNWPEKLELKPEEELDADEKALMFCEVKCKNYQEGER